MTKVKKNACIRTVKGAYLRYKCGKYIKLWLTDSISAGYIFHGTERNVSAELLRYKIRNGTSQIIGCDPSDHISTCTRHFTCIEHSTKYFTALFMVIMNLILLDVQ